MTLSVDDLGFRQSVTAVERLRTYDQKPFAFDAHWARWHATVTELGIVGTPDSDSMRSTMNELIHRNSDWNSLQGDFGVTWFATPGSGAQASPTFGMHLNALDHSLNHRRRTQGQPLVVTDVMQPDPNSWSRSIKVRCRLHYYRADMIARQSHPEAIGVLVDQDGTITETSIANIAIVQGRSIVSPPRARVLGGITQAATEQIVRQSDFTWSFRPIPPQELRQADEVLLMGTDTGVWFASQVDQVKIPFQGTGAVYQWLSRQPLESASFG